MSEVIYPPTFVQLGGHYVLYMVPLPVIQQPPSHLGVERITLYTTFGSSRNHGWLTPRQRVCKEVRSGCKPGTDSDVCTQGCCQTNSPRSACRLGILKMSSTDSSSLEPEVLPVKKRSRDKSKKKSKRAQADGKDEGGNPHWAYEPPEGAVQIHYEDDLGEFAWDDINEDEDLELWLVRVPEDLKPKYLEQVQVEFPTVSRDIQIGVVERKRTTYDIWLLGDDAQSTTVGGDEMRGLSCLLPHKGSTGTKLYQASKPITRHMAISAQPASPSPAVIPESASGINKRPPRQKYAANLLKHKFMPYGSLTPSNTIGDVVHPSQGQPITASSAGPSRKRKGDGETPKKSKKIKFTSS